MSKIICRESISLIIIKFMVLLVALLSIQSQGYANPKKNNEAIDKLCKKNPEPCKIKPRLSAFEDNYAIWQNTEDEENALEVRYSFRYMLTRPHCISGYDIIYKYSEEESRECITKYNNRWEMFFAYTGEFDFFLGTRESGPVVNRLNNPSIHFRKHIHNSVFNWFNISLEHRSNGQVTEIDETDGGILKTQIAYENNDFEYFDRISRGSNYIKYETQLKLFNVSEFRISAKTYIDHESDVNWGPRAKDNPSIKDYDRLNFVWSDQWSVNGKKLETSLQWVIGDEGFRTDSFDIGIAYPIEFVKKITIPVYLRIHRGPMKTLSNYTLDQNSIGIGIKLFDYKKEP